MHKNSGFTLIELIIVIAIVAILTAAGIPAYLSYIPNYRLSQAAGGLHGAVQMAKLKAVKENSNVVMQITTGVGENGGYVTFVDNGAGGGVAGDGSQDGAEPTVQDVPMPDGIDLYNTTFPSNRLAFNSRGLPLNNVLGSIRMQNASGKFQAVFLNIAGGASLRLSNDGAVWD